MSGLQSLSEVLNLDIEILCSRSSLFTLAQEECRVQYAIACTPLLTKILKEFEEIVPLRLLPAGMSRTWWFYILLIFREI
jgi:hypothetical protein